MKPMAVRHHSEMLGLSVGGPSRNPRIRAIATLLMLAAAQPAAVARPADHLVMYSLAGVASTNSRKSWL